MLIDILTHTPAWVFGLLAALLALGASQLRRRQVGLPRALLMPVAMAALSGWGVVSAFGRGALGIEALAVWAVCLVGVAWLLKSRPADPRVRYDAASRQFDLPGSAVPLLLIAVIFCLKYTVGVMLALQPQRAGDAALALGVSALYGLLSGVFASRGLRLWGLAQRGTPALA